MHAITVIFELFSPAVKTWTFLDLFSVFTESGWYLSVCHFYQRWKYFQGRQEMLFWAATFSNVLKSVSAVFRSILWALNKDRPVKYEFHPQINHPLMSCCYSFVIEIIWNSHFSSKPVCSGTKRLSVWAAAQSVWICATTCMVLSSFLDTSIQSGWKIEQ
jgi:hypothetical protein